jgi:hypothetical protein
VEGGFVTGLWDGELVICLQLVQEVIQGWDAFLQALAFARIGDDLAGLGGSIEGVTRKNLPMVEDALWESLSGCVTAQIGGETERLVDRQVCLDDEHGRASDLAFLENVTTTTIEYTINTTNGVFWTLNLAQVDRFQQTRGGCEDTGIQATASSRNDLATTTMDSVSVKRNVVDVETNTTHVLVAENTFLGCPLEAGDNRVLDFVQVLHT